jgi:uncharacterized protein (TIGR02117 family)
MNTRRLIRRIIRYLLVSIFSFIVLTGIYLLAAWTFSRIVIAPESPGEGDITAYLITNGVHTDIAVPLRTAVMDWNSCLPVSNTSGNDSSVHYIALGWGDKGFYLETPTWNDLKFSTAFNAVFGLDHSAVHATYYRNLRENTDCRMMHLTEEEYRRFITYVFSSLTLDKDSLPEYIKTTAVYGKNDAFYEANGSYNLFRTCNTWTNTALKVSGQKACFWTPFESGLMRLYR